MKHIVILLLTSIPAIAAADKSLEKSATWDCKKDPVAHIGNGKGTYTFKGPCTSISVGGGKNTITIESVDLLAVGGGKNTITIESVDLLEVGGADNKIKAGTVGTIDVGGADNAITWKKAKTGDQPTLKGQPEKNKISQAK